ncbi:hypothetical protein BT69DRAFT_1285090 [Atractiella rhizophila]|nr:hypothetical protein BT69DRAFT_1285090 [Atractiella rhizophila]
MATLDILGLGKRSRTSVDIAKRNNEDGTALSQSKKRKDEESEWTPKDSGVRSHARSRSLHEAATTPCFSHIFELHKVQSTASLPACSRMARDILSIPGLSSASPLLCLDLITSKGIFRWKGHNQHLKTSFKALHYSSADHYEG